MLSVKSFFTICGIYLCFNTAHCKQTRINDRNGIKHPSGNRIPISDPNGSEDPNSNLTRINKWNGNEDPNSIDDPNSVLFEPAINRNIPLENQNPDSNFPPKTDSGDQQTFKYPFAFAHKRIMSGGWTRQVTVDDLPVATQMSGVQMRLIRGGVREMHWHTEAEWAYVLYGECRITLVNDNAEGFVQDVRTGDLWFFPSGFPHSIQGIGDYGCFFLLVFNSGAFSEYNTFLLTNVMRSTPIEVRGKNFQVNPSIFDNLPKEELYMFAAELPRPLAVEQAYVNRSTPQSYAFFTDQWPYNVTRAGGTAKIVDATTFPVTTITGGIFTLYPGALRDIHWHPNADEWQYYIEGEARMTVYEANGNARTMDFRAGDVGYVQQSFPHYIENTGSENLVFLAVFPVAYYSEVTLATWLANTPSRLVNEHIRTGERFIRSITKTAVVIQP